MPSWWKLTIILLAACSTIGVGTVANFVHHGENGFFVLRFPSSASCERVDVAALADRTQAITLTQRFNIQRIQAMAVKRIVRL